MSKTPSAPADKITVRQAAPYHEIAADCEGYVGILYGGSLHVSNVSIIFDCSMLLYYLFWMFCMH